LKINVLIGTVCGSCGDLLVDQKGRIDTREVNNIRARIFVEGNQMFDVSERWLRCSLNKSRTLLLDIKAWNNIDHHAQLHHTTSNVFLSGVKRLLPRNI